MKKPINHLSPELQEELLEAWGYMRVIQELLGVATPQEVVEAVRERVRGA